MICTVGSHILFKKEDVEKQKCAVFLDLCLAVLFLTLGILGAHNHIMSTSASYALLGFGICYSMAAFLVICVNGFKASISRAQSP